MTEIKRNILLIGRTGKGKSTLANVLAGIDKFKESNLAVSETKNVQIEEVEVNGINYRIIDTVGIGDTQLTLQQVLSKLADASYSLKDGLNQVFFVTSGRFTEEEITAYNLLRTVIFDNKVGLYTTIIRTNFPDFEDASTCYEDIKAMEDNGGNLAKVIKSCKKVIHIDNPPVNLKNSKTSKQNQEIRNVSRVKVLTYLQMCKGIYKPENLDELNERISNYMDEKRELEKMVEDMKRKGENDSEMLRKYEEKIKNLERSVNLVTAQQVQKKDPGFFEEVGTWVGQAPKLLGVGLDKGVEKVDQWIVQPVKDNCRIM